MVKFLTTTSISAELENLIKSAREEVILISPYLKVNQRLQGFIRDADLRRIRLTVIYGKRDMQDAEREWINELRIPPETWFVPNLHAKCYLNEDAAIITSMNLYEFSQQNNDEMGIYVSRVDDTALFQDIKEEAGRLRRTAEPGQGTPTEPPPQSVSEQPPATKPDQQTATLGHCIRSGLSIPLDSEKPYCKDCYRIWVRYGDRNYREKFCHGCGEPYATSMANPLCDKCSKDSAGPAMG